MLKVVLDERRECWRTSVSSMISLDEKLDQISDGGSDYSRDACLCSSY